MIINLKINKEISNKDGNNIYRYASVLGFTLNCTDIVFNENKIVKVLLGIYNSNSEICSEENILKCMPKLGYKTIVVEIVNDYEVANYDNFITALNKGNLMQDNGFLVEYIKKLDEQDLI